MHSASAHRHCVAAAHASPTPHAQTGGAYDGPASRAVFDLAHEVKALLAPAQEEEGRRRARVRHLENLMLEWEEVFGQGSSALTPAVVVEQLRAQSAEIAQLRARLAATEEYAVAAEAEWERVLAGHHHQHRLELERVHAQFGAVSYTGGGGEAAPPSPAPACATTCAPRRGDRLERLRGCRRSELESDSETQSWLSAPQPERHKLSTRRPLRHRPAGAREACAPCPPPFHLEPQRVNLHVSLTHLTSAGRR